LWALRRKGLREYSHDELCALFLSYADGAYVFADPSGTKIIGTALAVRVSERVVRIPFIIHDGSNEVMAQMVSTLKKDFAGASVIAFKRRNRECEFPISELGRLLRLSQSTER
jgi:hypothetical protein